MAGDGPLWIPGGAARVGDDRRRLVSVKHASPERIEPFCRYFGTCGGCAIQHWQPQAYRAWKRRIVVETLEHAGIACEVDELIDVERALVLVTDDQKRLAFRLYMEDVPMESAKKGSIVKALGVSRKTAEKWIEEVRVLLAATLGEKT